MSTPSDRSPADPPPTDRPSSNKPSSDKPSSDKPSSDQTSTSKWIWPLALVLMTAILVGGALYVFRSLRDLPGAAVDRSLEVLHELQTVAAAFRQGTVETRFLSYATEVRGSNHLQFATLEQTEIFRRKDESSLLWGKLPLPEVVVEATAPVTYTYYVDFDDPWQFEIEDRTVRVMAPRIQFNKPSIDASEIRFETRSSSVFRDEEAAITALKAGLTQMSQKRARDTIQLVRELGRVQVEEFVDNWITRSFGDGGDYHVDVVFADEVDGGDAPENQRDRIRLREKM